MELALKGYIISIKVRKKQVESKPDPPANEGNQPPSPERHREEVEKQYLLASGSRYVGPVR